MDDAVKLRTDGTSLRLRLSADELERLTSDGAISEILAIGDNKLTYSIHASPAAADIVASFVDGRIDVLVPSEMLRRWAAGDEIGIASAHSSPKILIERDLARGRT